MRKDGLGLWCTGFCTLKSSPYHPMYILHSGFGFDCMYSAFWICGSGMHISLDIGFNGY